MKYGHATAALVVGKLCSSKRQQNALTAAIKEYGALRRTIFAARYLVDETYRRRIARQLNKGENLHSLRRELAYAGEGAVRRRYHEQQTEQMWCLTLATNAIVTWTTEYYGLAIAALRRAPTATGRCAPRHPPPRAESGPPCRAPLTSPRRHPEEHRGGKWRICCHITSRQMLYRSGGPDDAGGHDGPKRHRVAANMRQRRLHRRPPPRKSQVPGPCQR